MKRKLLPLAIAAAAAAQSGAVLADATVYGKANISVHQNDFEYKDGQKLDNSTLESNASRFGIKGKAKINDDLDAVFKMEYEVFLDDGDDGSTVSDKSVSSEFNQRNINAGLSSKTWGQIIAGKNDTPLKMAADGTDMFNDMIVGDINNYMVGENRENNIIIYNTPVMSGFTVTFATILGEEKGIDGSVDDSTQEDSGLFDRMSAALRYAPNEQFAMALSMDDNVQNADIVRLNATGVLGDFTLNAQVQQAEAHYDDFDANGTVEGFGDGMAISSSRGLGLALKGATEWQKGIEQQDAWMVNAKYQMGDWAFKAQYGESQSDTFDSATVADHTFDATMKTVGVDYAMSKNVTVYGYVSQLDVDVDNAATLTVDGDMNTAAVGFEVKF